MTQNGMLKNRRPQLSDAITKLDEMVDGLAIAIPGAVADSIRDTLGAAVAVAIKEAVKETMKDVVKEAIQEAAAELAAKSVPTPSAEKPATPPTPVAPTSPKPSMWVRVKATLRRLKNWVTKKAAPVVGKVAVGWAVMRVIGSSTMRSRTAAVATALSGTVAGLLGYAAGPVASALALALSGAAITAAALWAAPFIRYFVPIREE